MKFSTTVVFLILLLIACAGTTPAPTSAPVATAPAPAATAAPRALDPVAVLTTYDFAKNGQDVDASLALFADDAVVVSGNNVFTGTAEIRTWLVREAELNSQAEVVGQRTVQGDTVTWRSRITRDDLKQLGIAVADADNQAAVQDSLIQSFTITFAPAVQAQINAAQAPPPTPPASGISGARVITGTGATPADLKPTIDAYKAELGGVDNAGEPGSKGSGFRTIVWDGVPDDLAAPNDYPADFFNAPTAPRARGAVLYTPGSTLQVSAKAGNPTNTPPRFGNINPTYAEIFKTYSEERLFSPLDSNIVDLTFFVPGTNTPAAVRGYGAVYTDVDTDHTAFEYFDAQGNSLGVYGTPIANNALSFLGVVFPEPVIHRVRIEYGTVALGPDDSPENDVAVMDDFIYGEPIALPAGTVVSTPTAAITPTTGVSPTPVIAPTPVISPTAPISPTAAGGFVQVGSALNRDKSAAATDQNIAYGTTEPGNPYDTWATWAENQGNSRQIFVSRQNGDVWEPVGASLNIHTNVIAEKPSIDFAGADRAVPWVAWSEPSPGFGNNKQIFASRFNKDSGLWVPAGQDRGGNEPSLNVHTGKPATSPILTGGSLDPAQPPVPWICWQEDSANHNVIQIYVARGERDESALGGFKWVTVGPNRGGTAQDPEPSLNLDPIQGDGQHCWIAFAGENNTVPWVVWAEISGTKPSRVFASRGVADASAPGGMRWEFVPGCKDISEEAKCILNLNPTRSAIEPFLTAGSVVAGEPASPWVVWAEVGPSGKYQIYVNRLDPTTRDKFLNVGGSLNVDQNSNAQAPSITFVGNVPYVAWEEEVGAVKRIFVRHLASDPQTGTWTLDTPPDGLAVDKSVSAFYPIIHPKGNGVVFIYRQGDPETGETSQIIVCAGAGGTATPADNSCQ